MSAPKFLPNLPVKKNFEALDTVRTILALSVAAGHYFHWNGAGTAYPWPFFLAVDFFFILSGFVLTQSILAHGAPNMESFLRSFTLRRLFRLLPLYWLLAGLCAVLIFAQHGFHSDPFFYYAYSALLLQSVGFDAGAAHIFADTTIGIAWSISVELWVGLLFFPLVFVFKAKPFRLALVSAFLAIACLVIMINCSPNTLNVNFQRFAGLVTFGSIRGLLGFSLGTVCYLAYNVGSRKRVSPGWASLSEAAILGLLAILFLLKSYVHQNDYVAPLLFAVLIFWIALGAGYFSRALSWSLWAPMRSLSYAIYLVHPFYVFAWRELAIPFTSAWSALYFGLILVSAFVLHRWVERPGIAKGKLIISDLETRLPI